ncbi:hypothetical protein ILYODFUR_037610 [Ilyodon furcidens]|uniref:Uncharacterized protein n=1 Tax=Ilyodon furcidens TaxID=33524 RepID=A0ABV0U1N8_9TELE
MSVEQISSVSASGPGGRSGGFSCPLLNILLEKLYIHKHAHIHTHSCLDSDVYRYTDTTWPKKKSPPKKKRSHTRIFCWKAYSFDYSTHSLWHCIDKLLQCHKIYFQPVLHKFFTNILH